ncbi:MAG TPA: VCBS repeat-containing protein [Nannocystaceae bacterium]|nr:VCBS repeat-containing protein [Nannocystaceae bacterium]
MHELVAHDMLPASQLLAADLDGDGISELVAAQNDHVVVVGTDGEVVPLLDLEEEVVAMRWQEQELFTLFAEEEGTSILVRAGCDDGVARCSETDVTTLPEHTTAFELVDLDRDGLIDLLTRDHDGLAWSRGESDERWASFERLAVAPSGYFSDNGYATSIATGDIDGDGAIDVATVDEEHGVLVFLGAAARDDAPLVLGNPDAWINIDISDVTGDGIDDLVADQLEHTWVFHRAEGSALEDEVGPTERYPARSVIGDFDEAPGRDLLLLGETPPQLAKWMDAQWQLSALHVSEARRGYPSAVAAADFDGDGRDDFALARPELSYELP